MKSMAATLLLLLGLLLGITANYRYINEVKNLPLFYISGNIFYAYLFSNCKSYINACVTYILQYIII